MSKIVVGMSGGVDSAVVAYLLKKEGHDVIGIFMRNWDSELNNDILGNPNLKEKICSEEKDWQDVVKIGKQLKIPIKRVDFIKEYWDNVFKDLIKNYKKGFTPNPDILCNKYIKFGVFYDWVEKNIKNIDYIATGHYADIENNILKKPLDKWKDQTYFLAQISKEKLKKTIFPIAKYKKEEIRKIAEKNKLIVADKKDSTGICFIGERNFTQFLQNYIPSKPGKIIDITNNKEIGNHVGAMYYTIGQRKGLHLGGMKEPYYVAGHDLKKKIIYAAPNSRKEYLNSDQALITNINWLLNKKEDLEDLEVKFRYKSKAIKCEIKWINPNKLKVFYPQGFEAVTIGQQAVFYKNDFCLGGGLISKIYLKNKKIKYIK